MMFGLFGKKKERRHPVILDLSVKEKPDGWDELTRLGFEPVFVNHRPRPNGISGDYVQTRWRLKANPDVTCTVYDSWEGGGGATFLDFDAPMESAADTRRMQSQLAQLHARPAPLPRKGAVRG